MKQKINFSYYELSLLSFLKESHPELASDINFIKSRADKAAAAYADAFDNGYAIPSCVEIANEVLYAGLHFSKHDTIVTVLWNEFAGIVPEGNASEVAIRLLPLLSPVFKTYALSDEFAYSPEYQKLYTEITGEIQIIWERSGPAGSPFITDPAASNVRTANLNDLNAKKRSDV